MRFSTRTPLFITAMIPDERLNEVRAILAEKQATTDSTDHTDDSLSV